METLQNQSAFISLLLITILAALAPLLSTRFQRWRIPIVVGEILAGMLIGKSVLNLVAPNPILDFLAEFGFVFLMFISGLEVDISSLTLPRLADERRPFWHEPLFLALLSFGITLASAFVIAFGLVKMGLVRNPFIMGLILSTTSLGIVVPVLKERGIIPTSYGQLILVAALVADVITLVLLSMAFGIVRKGFALELILILLLMAIFAIFLRMGILAKKVPKLKSLVKELSTATAQIHVRGSMALMVAWAALAHVLGIEVILGAFLAGVIMSIIVGPEEAVLREKLDVLGFGFFIPIFFITVGSQFDLGVLLGSGKALILFPVLIVAAYAVKVISAFVYRLAFSWQESLASGFLLSSRLSLIIAASALAFELGVISDAVNANIILVAMVTCTFSPILFNRVAPHLAEVERKGVIIVGLNQLTALLAERLRQEGEEVAVLGYQEDRVNASYFGGVAPLFGDPTDESMMKSIGAEGAAALIASLNDAEANLSICRIAAERFDIPVIVSRADDHAMMEKMKAIGVRVIQPALATAMALEAALRFPAAFDMLADHGHNVEIGEATMRNAHLDGRALHQIRIPGNALVMGIRRKGEVVVPHGDTTFRLGDVVMLVGSLNDIREARLLLEARY